MLKAYQRKMYNPTVKVDAFLGASAAPGAGGCGCCAGVLDGGGADASDAEARGAKNRGGLQE